MFYRNLIAATSIVVISAMTAVQMIPNTLAAQQGVKANHSDQQIEADIPDRAIAVLNPTDGNQVEGVVSMQQLGDDVEVSGKITGLTPGKHGFHVHQYGDLRSPDGNSAGGHYTLAGEPHGAPGDEKHHAGDLGNINTDKDGIAAFTMTVKNLKLYLFIGRAIVVHGDADDLKSQPSGNAGARVAVGVIGIANPDAKK